MNRIDAWITFAAAAMASDKDGQIKDQAEWADDMLEETDKRWQLSHWRDEYTGYPRLHSPVHPPDAE